MFAQFFPHPHPQPANLTTKTPTKGHPLIMVAAPQLGTPDALVGILHGTEIDYVVKQKIVRQLMNTMPFAYHLLPWSNYFSSKGATIETPVITFEPGVVTTPLANEYGSTITNVDTLRAFLHKESGRPTPAIADLETPAVVDGFLLNYADTAAIIQNNWSPPSSLKVYQIAGTGLDTPVGLVYFTGEECVNRTLLICTQRAPKLLYRTDMAVDGDATVVVPSALALSDTNAQVERWWMNLDAYKSGNINRKHKDIFEIEDISSFVVNMLQATTSRAYTYLTDTAPIIDSGNRYDGDKKTLKLNGIATGSFTLEIEERSGSELIKRHTYSAIPSATSTKVSMDFNGSDSVAESVLALDYEGDGTVDVQYDIQGEIIVEENELFTYNDLTAHINALIIHHFYKNALTKSARNAELFYTKSQTSQNQRQKRFYEKAEVLNLKVLLRQIWLQNRFGRLSNEDKSTLEHIIQSILNRTQNE